MTYASSQLRVQSAGSPQALVACRKAWTAWFGERRLSTAVVQMAIVEFATIIATGYGLTLGYCLATYQEWADANPYLPVILGIAGIEQAVVLASGQYLRCQDQAKALFCFSGTVALVVAASLFLSTIYLSGSSWEISREIVLAQLSAMAVSVATLRALYYARLQRLVQTGRIDACRVILIGESACCEATATSLRTAGIRTVCSFAIPPQLAKTPAYMRTIVANIATNCRSLPADDVIILADANTVPILADITGALAELPVTVQVLPAGVLDLTSSCRIVRCGNLFALRIYDKPLTNFDRVVKRTFDIVAAASGMILLLPVFLIIAIAIKIDSSGPVLFVQRRHGYNNIPIRVFKFRTMTVMEDGKEIRQATKHDRRVTRIGRILRQTSIDELPQLYNVLIGDMSIVGPRPHAIAHNEMFDGLISSFWRRHSVKPGITGWAQVHGCRGETDTVEKMRRRIEHDLYYIDHWSFLFDLKIVIMTAFSKATHLNAH